MVSDLYMTFCVYDDTAIGGAALVIQEMTAIQPNGRITGFCAGLWKDEHMEPATRVVNFIHSQQALAGVQLAHAGRKVLRIWPLACLWFSDGAFDSCERLLLNQTLYRKYVLFGLRPLVIQQSKQSLVCVV